MSEALKAKFSLRVQVESMKLEDAEATYEAGDVDLIQLEIQRITKAIGQLKLKNDEIIEALIEEEKTVADIKEWKDTQVREMKTFAEMKIRLEMKHHEGIEEKLQSERDRETRNIQQKYVIEEQSLSRRIKMEQELVYVKEKLMGSDKSEDASSIARPQAVRLQKYTITPFRGDYKDWLRFWNQFTVEIDKSTISEISKFNYLLELVRDKPRDDILGLPHTEEGYEEAKRILVETYGKDIKVKKAIIKEIENLQSIRDITRHSVVHEFYNKLSRCVRTLKTMRKLDSAQSLVYTLMDKLGPVREILAQSDDDWEDWGLEELVENLRKYVDRNPLTTDYKRHNREGTENKRDHRRKDDRIYHTRDENQADIKKEARKNCLFCGDMKHMSSDCEKIKTVAERKTIFVQKKLCFNCGGDHRASQCRSQRGCSNCKAKHHTSLCDRTGQHEAKEPIMLTPMKGVIYPVVIGRVNGQKCRIFLDTGTGGRYASSTLIEKTKPKLLGTVDKNIQMLLHTTKKTFQEYELTVSNLEGDFEMKVCVTKVDKQDILQLENPRYDELIGRHKHLTGIQMNEESEKRNLPVHLILGSGEFAKLKTETCPRIGRNIDDPVAELTKLGWVIYSPGEDDEVTPMNLIKSVDDDYKKLISLDVLGIKDESDDQSSVYEEFEEQLEREEDGSYRTGLLWKPVHPHLPSNESRSKARLASTLKRLARDPEKLQTYDEIIKTQLKEGIVEEVTPEMITDKTKQFFIPHKMVVKENAETTKNRIVYDASARASDSSPSLNDCLETGPPLQNQIWDILVRNRFKPIIITADLKQAFLQVRIRENDRNFLQFHWIKDTYTQEIQVLRFTRALFGLGQSPFLLGATIKHHLQEMRERYPEVTADIERELYVDDLIHGENHLQEARRFKPIAKEIFQEAHFILHKWHSNVPELEEIPEEEKVYPEDDEDDDETYAKQKLKTSQVNDARLLGLGWNKKEDTLCIKIPQLETAATKRGVLKYLATIYDPLGFLSPITLKGKLIFRDLCDEKYSWDQPLEGEFLKRWNKFKTSLPSEVTLPRSVVKEKEALDSVDLHVFCDASKNGVAAAVYAVTRQGGQESQGLIAAKSRLPKKTTIPRLELTAAHMGAHMWSNVADILKDVNIRRSVVWSDSTVALHWINGNGDLYKQFVRNQVRKISELKVETWRHVPGTMNPVDVGSRGATYHEIDDTWWNGPEWLRDERQWPENIETQSTEESDAELKKQAQEVLVMMAADEEEDPIKDLISNFNFKKSVRVLAWLLRFRYNCQYKDSKKSGPLTTEDWSAAKMMLIRKTQQDNETTPLFQKHMEQLNLVKEEDGIYRCYGRIQGEKPIYLPTYAIITEKLVMAAHMATLHGGVGLIMTHIREKYWIPRLRQLAKRVRSSCYGCKRYQVRALLKVKPAPLPQDRTTGWRPFQVIGLDYAGPFTYKKSANTEGKAYILLYSCSLTRAVYLELVRGQSSELFLPSLKRMIARRGRPEKIYSDNFSTFVSTAKWLKKAVNSEEIHDFLASQDIKWQFNLSRAPWWGGQFERLVGLVKAALYKSIGKSVLTWDEMIEVLLDVETTVNNRPLSYVEEDVEMPILTPNVMAFGQPNHIPEEDVAEIDDKDLRKRAKYLKKCKDGIWRRWRGEYLRGLRERHNLAHPDKKNVLSVGDVMLIKGDEKNRCKWKIGIVTTLITGRDGEIRGARLRAGRSYLERAVEHLYPMELSCDMEIPDADEETSPVRPTRNAAAIARSRIQDAFDDEVDIE